ncbi:peptidoglycan-binding domain-containing protein [Alicyclobacillus macrosporangiidus]|uniref:peptidoglycan-binding domain-containing protein n=1 Tax=Alicyclobacillus macrosporangiidus TaxID=392015 RepID=UPI000A6E621C|nr:peptidoglycan-binding domain-containing protein [Alicyclobacillus macrosporangiidus]
MKILPGNQTIRFTKVTEGQMVGGTNVWYFDAADNGWISYSALKWVSYPGLLVRYGSQGPFVEEVQYQLNHLGYTVGAVDGIFGTKTLGAVRAFQKAHGLTADGGILSGLFSQSM